MRHPDFIIGPPGAPYLKRWWLIPRNRFFNIYLHNILADDDDRALHDHPWWNLSFILGVGYREITPSGAKVRGRFSLVLRRPTAAHRLALFRDADGNTIPTWSLFITGPRVREWGFICPKGWRHWKDFVNERDTGQIGRGCDD